MVASREKMIEQTPTSSIEGQGSVQSLSCSHSRMYVRSSCARDAAMAAARAAARSIA
jgi:hypothetical protein